MVNGLVWCPLRYMVWCGLVWCSIHYALWSGADWSGVESVTLYGLVLTGLIGSVMVYGLAQPGLVQSCYGIFPSGLRW